MLIGQHRRRYQDGDLLRVAGSFEGGTYGHLRLAEAHVTTHEAVHRLRPFHVGLHIVGGLQLVGGVLIEERCLQFLLHEGVGRIGKALLLPTGGIEADKVAGDVLEFLLGTLLHALPLARTEMRQARRLATVLRLVFRDLIERVDGHIDGAPAVVLDLDHLLVTRNTLRILSTPTTLNRHAHQTGKLADAVVDMHDIVTNLKLLYLLQRQGHLAAPGLVRAQVVLVETVEYLVIGKDAELLVVIDEAGMERFLNGRECDGILLSPTLSVEDVVQTSQLLRTIGKDTETIAIGKALLERLLQEFEVLMELRLG